MTTERLTVQDIERVQDNVTTTLAILSVDRSADAVDAAVEVLKLVRSLLTYVRMTMTDGSAERPLSDVERSQLRIWMHAAADAPEEMGTIAGLPQRVWDVLALYEESERELRTARQAIENRNHTLQHVAAVLRGVGMTHLASQASEATR